MAQTRRDYQEAARRVLQFQFQKEDRRRAAYLTAARTYNAVIPRERQGLLDATVKEAAGNIAARRHRNAVPYMTGKINEHNTVPRNDRSLEKVRQPERER